jgi:hypothetical protein
VVDGNLQKLLLSGFDPQGLMVHVDIGALGGDIKGVEQFAGQGTPPVHGLFSDLVRLIIRGKAG